MCFVANVPPTPIITNNQYYPYYQYNFVSLQYHTVLILFPNETGQILHRLTIKIRS